MRQGPIKLSFVIPAYNEAATIGRCLNSIQAELARHSDLNAEIIVVNNASTDQTKAVVANSFPHVEVVDEPRKGILWARQAGLKRAQGELVANIDADTTLPTGWVETVIREFGNDPSLVALSGPHVYLDASSYVRFVTKLWYIVGYAFNWFGILILGKSGLLQGGNYVVKRDALEKIGGYNTKIEFYGEDVDTGARLSTIGKVKWTFAFPIYASARRIEKNGLMKTGSKYALTYLSVLFRDKPYTQEYDDIRT